MSTQEDVLRQAHELERLRSELKRVQDQFKESEEKSLKEKQNFTMRLEKALAFSTHLPNIDDSSKCQPDAVSLQLIFPFILKTNFSCTLPTSSIFF